MSEDLPLVTFALFAYNQQETIREAVEAALAQDYPNLEIILSDDASEDDTWQRITALVAAYRGPHRVTARRNVVNAGIAAHINQLFALSHGALIVVAAGDDVSHPGRVTRLVDAWMQAGCPDGALHSRCRVIAADGSWTGKYGVGRGADPARCNLKAFVASDFAALMHGATAAYTRNVFQQFGPLSGGVEDVPLTFRALLIGQILHVDEVLVDYRVGVGNVSAPLRRRDLARVDRWLGTVLKMLSLMKQDFAGFSDPQGAEDTHVLEALIRLEKRYSAARGLASPNLLRNAVGLVRLPLPGGWRDRLWLAVTYFGLLNGKG